MNSLWLPLCALAGPGVALDEVLWERNSGWTRSEHAVVARCEVPETDPCPCELRPGSGDIAWTFPLPQDAAQTPDLRFELAVVSAAGRWILSTKAGPEGETLADAGTIAICAPGVHRLVIPTSRFRPGGRNEIRLRGESRTGAVPAGASETRVEANPPPSLRWIAAGLYRHHAAPPDVSDRDLLDDTQWRACRYFYEQTFPNGLVLDTMGSGVASIAATGFGLTSLTILDERAGTGASRRWTISREAARARAGATLRAVREVQERQSAEPEEWGWAGLPYHLVDERGRRARKSEVSSVDGALLLAGVLQAGQHFGGALREQADAIFRNADLKRLYRKEHNRYSHGWRPEGGLFAVEWDRPGDETLLVCLLSLARDPADPDRLRACYGYPRESEEYAGIPVVRSYFGSLFTYAFAHFWIPFDRLGSDRPRDAGMPDVPAVDWWENSRRAVEASRRYHLDRLREFPALGEDAWGASSCYRADRLDYFGANGAAPAEARPAFDGTIPPHAAVMSIFLAGRGGKKDLAGNEDLGANPAFRALRHYYRTRLGVLWCSYGPRSSFDARGNVSPMVVGVEKGPEALGIEAFRTGRPARELASHPAVAEAISKVFEGRP